MLGHVSASQSCAAHHQRISHGASASPPGFTSSRVRIGSSFNNSKTSVCTRCAFSAGYTPARHRLSQPQGAIKRKSATLQQPQRQWRNRCHLIARHVIAALNAVRLV